MSFIAGFLAGSITTLLWVGYVLAKHDIPMSEAEEIEKSRKRERV
jgi:hypothetical protein